jgi:DNA mismatch repair protein MutS2
MDTHTLELLDFGKIRALVAARTACSLGKVAAEQIEPSTDPGEIHSRQALTTEMVEAIGSTLRPPFGGLHDIRHLARRASKQSVLEAEELAQTLETLRAIGNLDSWLARIGDQFARLGGLRQEVAEFSGLAVAIEGCLDNRGKVLDTASRRLSALRRDIGRAQERIQETLRQMLRSPEIRRILRFPNFTMVGHHYVLPVAKDHRGEVQGSVLRTSASNETVYIEPTAISEQSAQLSYLRAREAKEVRRILRWLSAQVGMLAEPLVGTLDTLANLDLIHARARLSIDYRMSLPHFNQEGRLILRSARHPLLEALFRSDPALIASPPRPFTAGPEHTEAGSVNASPLQSPPDLSGPLITLAPDRVDEPEPKTVTPIDVNLGLRFQILVVTGPNTGGKTVALKTVGLLAIMAQAGLHVPAGEGSQFPIFDDVLTDIGDEQSLEQSLSTFSSHVGRIREILGRATSRSLVLLDELGAGTDPTDGAALGRAILDELDRIGCRAIVTTHIGDLKTYALSNERAENAAVEFDDQTFRPRYRLHIGDIGLSNALKIARQLRLPEHVVARAEAYLAQRKSGGGPDWDVLPRLRKEAEEAREAAIMAQAEAQRMREALAERMAQLQQESQKADTIALARARLQPGDRVVVPRLGYDRPGRLVKLDPRKKSAVVAIGHVTWNVAIDELIPQTIRAPSQDSARGSPGGPKNPAARRPVLPEDGDDDRGP